MTSHAKTFPHAASILPSHSSSGHGVTDPRPWLEVALSSNHPPRLVSFDVFDTLIWRRTLFPQDVFLSLSTRLPRPSAWMRRQAERVATIACQRLFGREPTLRDIYRLLPSDARRELALETKFCVPNPFCLAAVAWLRDIGIPVVAISDMYLDAEEIGGLLAACGYPPMPVYSSASEGCTKGGNGDLFAAAWGHIGTPPADTAHVGDNPHSDIAMAMRRGAAACHVATPRTTLFDIHPAALLSDSADDSIFWGELAIRLHLETASATNGKQRFGRAIEILAQQQKIARLPLEDAWRELQALASPPGDRRDAD